MAAPLRRRSLSPATHAGRRDLLVLCVFALALFANAALLFLVQPLVSRMLLPRLGGSPAVWTTSLLFFQAALLAGYLYSHVLSARLSLSRQLAVHAVTLTLPFLSLPLGFGAASTLSDGMHAAAVVLTLLTFSVGLPFFAVATSAPLLQRWFSRTGHPSAGDPYFLYAASNAGNMLGLLAYPLLLERHLRLAEQGRVWTGAYAVLLALVGTCALLTWRDRGAGRACTPAPIASGGIGGRRRLAWLSLSFVPCSLMLGVTTYITTDIAAVPLLWLPPLALYLASFIVAFSRAGAVLQPALRLLAPLAALALFGITLMGHGIPLWKLVAGHLAALFVIAAAYHGELAAQRPGPSHLTEFYLWLSLGGVAGGLFNAIAAPVLFSTILEYPIAMALGALVLPLAAGAGLSAKTPESAPAPRLCAFFPVYAILLAAGILLAAINRRDTMAGKPLLHRERSFFGVLTVAGDDRMRELRHGTTTHGKQAFSPELRYEPLTYYHRKSPIADIFRRLEAMEGLPRVAVVGLGTGTLAAYARSGQSLAFYEIDRAVERISRDPRYFTYLADAEKRGVAISVVIGDARMTLKRSAPGTFGLIAIDAFSSDAIPVHLLTREALALYLDKARPDGIVAFHISNRHLELGPVLAALARDAGLFGMRRDAERDEDPDRFYRSDWIALSRSLSSLLPLAGWRGWRPLPQTEARPWTDDFSDVLGALKWP